MMKRTVKDYIFVGIQLILFLGFIFNPSVFRMHLHNFFQGMGYGFMIIGVAVSAIAVVQLNRNLSTFPSPKPGSELIATGLYKRIRHPIYLGVLLTGLGFALGSNSGFRLVLTLLLFLLFYFKSEYEEKRLTEKFPGYTDYKKHTGRFISHWR